MNKPSQKRGFSVIILASKIEKALCLAGLESMKGFIMLGQNNDTKNKEVWKDIPEYEGMYQVSNFGRVKSLKRKGRKSDKILRPYKNKSGYLSIGLCRDNKLKKITIHKLVMQAFVGECPDGMETNHKDGDKANNHVDNLEYCTRSQNMQHAIETGLQVASTGEKHGNSKLTKTQVLEIRARYKAGGISQYKLAREYGVNHQTISKIVNRKRWTHI